MSVADRRVVVMSVAVPMGRKKDRRVFLKVLVWLSSKSTLKLARMAARAREIARWKAMMRTLLMASLRDSKLCSPPTEESCEVLGSRNAGMPTVAA